MLIRFTGLTDGEDHYVDAGSVFHVEPLVSADDTDDVIGSRLHMVAGGMLSKFDVSEYPEQVAEAVNVATGATVSRQTLKNIGESFAHA